MKWLAMLALALAFCQAVALPSTVAAGVCVAACPDDDEAGACGPACLDCVCCGHTPIEGTPAERAGASLAIGANGDEEPFFAPELPPFEILHVPERRFV